VKATWENHFSLWLFRPLDAAAKAWINETAPDDAQFMGDAMAVAPRYVEGVQAAFEAAGGEVS
jgi:hypothetical protein